MTRPATPLVAGVLCYLIWGFVPLVFQAMGRLGMGSWEILAHRSIWGAPTALLFVLMAGQGPQALAVFRNPRLLAGLFLSALLIGSNWALYVWAVNSGKVLETSLGYYLTPLLNMAAGVVFFRERLDRVSIAAMVLAAIGVAVQGVAVGHLPWVSLILAVSFGGLWHCPQADRRRRPDRSLHRVPDPGGSRIDLRPVAADDRRRPFWPFPNGHPLAAGGRPDHGGAPGPVFLGGAAHTPVDHRLPAIHRSDHWLRHRRGGGRGLHAPARPLLRLHLGRGCSLCRGRLAAHAAGVSGHASRRGLTFQARKGAHGLRPLHRWRGG